jgi:hypothetical protein
MTSLIFDSVLNNSLLSKLTINKLKLTNNVVIVCLILSVKNVASYMNLMRENHPLVMKNVPVEVNSPTPTH